MRRKLVYNFHMNQLARQLDERLSSLEPEQAKLLESLVREALARVEAGQSWPAGYFERTAGALAGEDFERPDQGELPHSASW